MFISILMLVRFIGAEPTSNACHVKINESSSNTYHSQRIILNPTLLVNVKQMKILQHSDLFTIDSHSVTLQAIRKIDHEILCKQNSNCDCDEPMCAIKVTILIVYLSVTNLPPYRVTRNICIYDVNDNKPTFPEPTQSLNINENVDPGTVYELHSASDLDSQRYTVVRYELKCPEDVFNLSYTVPVTGSLRSDHRVQVTVTKRLLYRSDPIVCDLAGCDIDHCSWIKLIVNVNDVNDHRPQWAETKYLRSVKENILPDTVIDKFQALDTDPVYGKISYSIARIIATLDEKASTEGLFSIDSSSGELRINKNLDYEESAMRKFQIIIVAKDNGSPSLSASATVQISVENVNDLPPKIVLNKQIIDVKENAEPTFLDYFTVTDDDDLDSDRIMCHVIEPGDMFHLKKANGQSPIVFELYSTHAFDYEKQTMITITIRCDDGGAPDLSSVKRITVNVIDINDNAVQFRHKVIHVSIAENAPIGSDITQLRVDDLDRRSSLSFTLTDPNNCSYINIDPSHGFVTTNAVFDRESKDLYTFRVKVEERDFLNFSDVADVILRITDTNDNSPSFKEPYTFYLAENVSVNTLIGRVDAMDPDLGSNGSVTYYHGLQIDKMPDYFRVASNGEIRLFQHLDFETQSIHNIVVVARDHGPLVTLSSTTTVIVKVIDSNDHPPRFEERTTVLTLQCQSQDIGKDLIAIIDKDQSPENTMIYYEIEKVEPSKFKSMFHINRTTGLISMHPGVNQCKFKFSSREKADITLKIYDPTKPEFKDRANILLTLESEKNDASIENSPKVSKNGGAGTWFKRNNQGPGQGETGSQNRTEEYIDQNVIIVMILIFITIFLGIILISLVCFIKRRRDAEDEQEIAENIGMVMEKVNSPLQSHYSKNSDTFNLTMKNVSANETYYPTLTDSSRGMISNVNITANSPRTIDEKMENKFQNYTLPNVKENSAYQSLTVNPRSEEQYSIIESFLQNSQFEFRDKMQRGGPSNKMINSTNSANQPYVAVSFV